MDIKITARCAICGSECNTVNISWTASSCSTASYSLAVECPECKRHIANMERQVGIMEDQIFNLERQVNHVPA